MAYEYLLNFGAKIRLLRIQQKWAPKELARRLNWSVETLYLVERGGKELTVVQANEVARMLHVPLNQLL